ncbi:uncharacterized protein BO97DRAFT_424484 [Aspergillus homomorphus CBS 101889]|uniref:Uncharacterized protein n=1 Tax=Aspergillus homomorphus (strain CBS 101889) TaxID=1450537 RepID=A0A395HXZ3_ASPHC|nr:hypothetical protein BO97DRAFT_424484 [Aspergillus homomorphus CBS 101889]RAL12396.1 hypothetical protein BO97DRAFT_424484 [Aspergillus homomorphus CBS 101889]
MANFRHLDKRDCIDAYIDGLTAKRPLVVVAANITAAQKYNNTLLAGWVTGLDVWSLAPWWICGASNLPDYNGLYTREWPSTFRVASYKFRQDGLLLPFGYPRHEFVKPNPTLFQTVGYWPMTDRPDPLHGWSLKEVLSTSSGAATADIYGKLYFHLRRLLDAFLNRMSDAKLTFEFHHKDTSLLVDHLDRNSFDRIEGSWVFGMSFFRGTLASISHAQPACGPYNPLIKRHQEDRNSARSSPAIFRHPDRRTFTEVPTFEQSSAIISFDLSSMKLAAARGFMASYDYVFERFLKEKWLPEGAETAFSVTMKDRHTIIEKWPFQLKLRPGDEGAQEEFDLGMRQWTTGKERFIEWKGV